MCTPPQKHVVPSFLLKDCSYPNMDPPAVVSAPPPALPPQVLTVLSSSPFGTTRYSLPTVVRLHGYPLSVRVAFGGTRSFAHCVGVCSVAV